MLSDQPAAQLTVNKGGSSTILLLATGLAGAALAIALSLRTAQVCARSRRAAQSGQSATSVPPLLDDAPGEVAPVARACSAKSDDSAVGLAPAHPELPSVQLTAVGSLQAARSTTLPHAAPLPTPVELDDARFLSTTGTIASRVVCRL